MLLIYNITNFRTMPKRVTIMLDSDLDKKIRTWQAKKIKLLNILNTNLRNSSEY